MPLAARTRPAGNYGQATLDPSRPLYVRRRIMRGAAPALVAGEVFDPAGVAPMRLRMLYQGRFISHDKPGEKPVSPVAAAVAKALARAAAANDAPPPTPEPAPPLEPPPAKLPKPTRARAGA